MVKFTGKEMEAPFSGNMCVYFEIALFYEVGTSTGHHHSQEKFIAQIDGKTVEIGVPPARLSLQPIFEKEFETKKAPEKFTEIFNNVFGEEMPEKVVVKEWVLLADNDYIVNVKKEKYYLPPLPGSDEPNEENYTMYEIMDKEYNKEEKEKYRTPASFWTGG
ncbi:MAG: hypothetical protein ABID61_00590 [Candidatus Micrarchaeota archaeon]